MEVASAVPWSLYALGAAFPDLLLNGQLWQYLIQLAARWRLAYHYERDRNRSNCATRRAVLWVRASIPGVVDIGYCRRCDPGGVVWSKGAGDRCEWIGFRYYGDGSGVWASPGTPEGKSLRDTMIFWAILSTVFGSMGGM